MWKVLEQQLALAGFDDGEALKNVWKRVDPGGNGYLDFSEFLCLLFLWANVGDYANFFEEEINRKVVSNAFVAMESNWAKYDLNHSRKLDREELTKFISIELNKMETLAKPVIEDTCKEGREISFPRFMHMLYVIACKMENTKVPGKYASPLGVAKEEFKKLQEAHLKGPESQTWKFLAQAFHVRHNSSSALCQIFAQIVLRSQHTSQRVHTWILEYARLEFLRRTRVQSTSIAV